MRSLIAMAVVLFASTALMAAESPEFVTLKAKNGNITFNHKNHGQKTSCGTCHGETIGPLEPIGEDKGHAMCITCHKSSSAGPTKCGDCHKK